MLGVCTCLWQAAWSAHHKTRQPLWYGRLRSPTGNALGPPTIRHTSCMHPRVYTQRPAHALTPAKLQHEGRAWGGLSDVRSQCSTVHSAHQPVSCCDQQDSSSPYNPCCLPTSWRPCPLLPSSSAAPAQPPCAAQPVAGPPAAGWRCRWPGSACPPPCDTTPPQHVLRVWVPC